MAKERTYGRYILEERIAMGGMAEIFRARMSTEGFDKKVCIKRVLPHFLESEEFVAMFRDEAKLAAKLQHANVVQMFDFGEEEETLFLAMELVVGADLKRLTDLSKKTQQPFGIGQATQVAIEMARGLYHAHTLIDEGQALNIVHRDISPHNVLVSHAGEVKVTDFGIAKAAARSSHTSTGVVKGKLSYMAPEQADGSKIDHRVDQFATAIVLWETLCGEKLFTGDNEAIVLRKVLTCEVRAPSDVRSDVPAVLEDVILKALSPVPADRYADMRAFERALTRAIFDLSDDPGFTDLRPLVTSLLAAKDAPRKTALLPAASPALANAAAPAPVLAPAASSSVEPHTGVFSSGHSAKAALEKAGLAADEVAETMMADATMVAGSVLDDEPQPSATDETEPTRTIVPAETLSAQAQEDAAPASPLSSVLPAAPVLSAVLASANDASEVDPASSADPTGAPLPGAPSPAATFPRRIDPEAIVTTERVARAPGPARIRITPPLIAIGALLGTGLLGVLFAVLPGGSDDAAPQSAKRTTALEVTGDPAGQAGESPLGQADEPPPGQAKRSALQVQPSPNLAGQKAASSPPKETSPPKDIVKPAAQVASEKGGSDGVRETASSRHENVSNRREDASNRKSSKRRLRQPPPKHKTASKQRKKRGRVFVNVRDSWANIFEGGKKLGTTPARLSLAVGKHRLKLVNPETKRSKTVVVHITPDKLKKVIVSW